MPATPFPRGTVETRKPSHDRQILLDGFWPMSLIKMVRLECTIYLADESGLLGSLSGPGRVAEIAGTAVLHLLASRHTWAHMIARANVPRKVRIKSPNGRSRRE